MSEQNGFEKNGLHAGHRQRMYQKMDAGALAPHEILEVLLYDCLRRVNTNEIAHRLLMAFGSVSKVLAASTEQLKTVKGVGDETARHLKKMQALVNCVASERGKEETYPSVFSGETFPLFLQKEYRALPYEVFDFYLLDRNGRIVFRQRYDSTDKRRVRVETWQLVSILSSYKPSGVVMAHNHLSGKSEPSEQDERTTDAVKEICRLAGTVLCDHYICSDEGVYSYYSAGKIRFGTGDAASRNGRALDGELKLF